MTQLVPVAVAVAADYCTLAMLGDGDAVLVCGITESSFEVTAVRRKGDRLVLLGDRAKTPSVGASRPGGDVTPAGDDARNQSCIARQVLGPWEPLNPADFQPDQRSQDGPPETRNGAQQPNLRACLERFVNALFNRLDLLFELID